MVIDLRRYRTRMIVAFAIAIALHEIALGLLRPPARPSDDDTRAAATIVSIRSATPTPHPTPAPTPPPHVTPRPHVTIAPVPQVAARAQGRPATHRGGGAHRAPAKTPARPYANPNAAGSGLGTSLGHGSGNAPAIGGGLGGRGAGLGGIGNAEVNANTPCGEVDFAPRDPPHYANGTATEVVYATVLFPDGHKETERFPYPWVYPDGEHTDPWSNSNLAKPNFEIALQQPPPGSERATFPPLIQYILSHSDAGGFTDLPDCPKNVQ